MKINIKINAVTYISLFVFCLLFTNSLLAQKPGIREKKLWGNVITKVEDHNIPANSGCSINITHKLGKIKISSWKKDEIHLKITKRISVEKNYDKEETDKFLKNMNTYFSSRSNIVSINTEYPYEKNRRIKSSQTDLEIHVPAKSEIDVRNTFGDVSIAGIEGRIFVNTTHALVDLKNINGDIDIKNKFGKIMLTEISGETEAYTNNGDIIINGVKSSVSATNKFGGITIKNVTGNIRANTTNSTLSVNNVSGRVELGNSFGNTELRKAGADIVINSKNGNTILTDITGDIWAEGSFGNINVTDAKKGCRIHAKNCKITVTRVAGSVDVTNTFGNLRISEAGKNVTYRNTNGAVDVWLIKGNVDGENNHGTVNVKSVDGKINLNNSNGPVTVSGIKGITDIRNSFAPVILENTLNNCFIINKNGNIEISANELTASPDQTQKRIKASTTFGIIKLLLPKEPSVEIDAETTYGEIYSSLQIEKESYSSTRRLRGTVNEGRHIITLETSNSSIYIETGNKN